MDLLWRRNTRATRITLRIDASLGKVVVTLPTAAHRAAGRALLARNAAWVESSLAALPVAPTLAAGSTVKLDGEPYLIRSAPGRAVIADGSTLTVGDAGIGLRRRLLGYLRGEALSRLAARATSKAASAGLSPAAIRVRDPRARWGSCSPAGDLMFSWRLVMAPVFVQDYVVAHEAAHLRHHDHSRQFWALTEALTPYRAAAEAWLRAQGSALLRVGRD